MRTLRVQVTLRRVTPPVRRVLDVPAASTMPELHELLQAGVGWTNSHLHEFIVAGLDADPWAGGLVRYGVPDPDVDGVEPVRDEATARMRDLGAAFVYLYDFGDCWAHDVAVLGPGADRAGCVYGEGACPPENCGGPTGYAELLALLADPARDDYAQMRVWAGPPVEFDHACTDALLRRTVGTVPAGVALLLEQLRGGVRLTLGGRLPRALVRAVQEHRPDWAYTDRPARGEDDVPVLAALHDLLREVGLLRLRHGVLAPTRAATDELNIVRRLRSWFGPEEGFTSVLAGTTVAALVVDGPQRLDELTQQVHPLLDRWAHRDGTPLTAHDVGREIARLASVLRALDLVGSDGAIWSGGDSADGLLHRATALAHIWGLPRYRDCR